MESEEEKSDYVRTIIATPKFDEFYYGLPVRVQNKFDFVINVMATVYNVPAKFVKHLQNTNLYEMRVTIGPNEYRTVLFAADNINFIEAKKILLLNGFLKKSNKDYKKQVEIAAKILNDLEQ